MSFPHSSVGKESACNAGNLGSIPRSGRSPGEGNSNRLQYSCLENLMDWRTWQATVHVIAESDKTYRLNYQSHSSAAAMRSLSTTNTTRMGRLVRNLPRRQQHRKGPEGHYLEDLYLYTDLASQPINRAVLHIHVPDCCELFGKQRWTGDMLINLEELLFLQGKWTHKETTLMQGGKG